MNIGFSHDWPSQGIELQKQGRIAEAETLYRQVLVHEPRNASALLFLGILIAQSGQIKRAIEYMKQASTLDPALAAAHENLGRALEMQGKFREAEVSYGRLIALAPSHAEGYAARARVLEAQGRLEEALGDHDKAVGLKSDTALVLNRGMILLKLQRPEDALASFDKAISMGFHHPVVFYNRGVVLAGLNRSQEAVLSFDKALAIQPTADCWNNRGAALQSLKRWPEALQSFDAAIALKSDYPQVWVNRGSVLDVLERFEEALASYERALSIAPNYAQGWNNRSAVLHNLKRYEDAVASFDRAIACDPRHASGFINRGLALEKLGRFEEAVDSHNQAIVLEPGLEEASLNRGRLLCTKLNRVEDALAGYDAFLARRPDSAMGHSHRADTWRWAGKPQNALADCDSAVALRPASAEMRTNRALAFMDMGRLNEALSDFDEAIALDVDNEQAYFKKGLLLLLQASFQEGFALYEARDIARQPADRRLSRGDILAGKKLFVKWEQGYGDIIQFCRYCQLAKARGATVSMSVPDSIMRLLRGLNPSLDLIAGDAVPEAYDFYSPMMSLPHYFDTVEESIPALVPYLTAEPALVAKWRAIIGQTGFRIGICWQGNIETDPSRSFALREIAPLAKVPGVRLISLQMGSGLAQLDDPYLAFCVERLGADFNAGPDAFIDSAAVMENLDLVISCDTAAAHLAGALGRPVWTALKYVPDWRWQLQRSDSPWYPTMALFRQVQIGDWNSVFRSMAHKLMGLQRPARLS